MEIIKKIIKEELTKVLSVLHETDFYKTIDYKQADPKDNIIYDYEKGKIFAGDNLEVDIVNLNRYHLVEYLPKDEFKESWSFEFETVHGTTLIVDIERMVNGGKSFWSMKFGQLYKEQATPHLIAELKNIKGYDNFIATVNKNLANQIDPSKY